LKAGPKSAFRTGQECGHLQPRISRINPQRFAFFIRAIRVIRGQFFSDKAWRKTALLQKHGFRPFFKPESFNPLKIKMIRLKTNPTRAGNFSNFSGISPGYIHRGGEVEYWVTGSRTNHTKGTMKKHKTQPQGGSYESTLSEEQQEKFHTMLLSDITLAETQQKAPAWATGPDIGKKPFIASLGKIRMRIRLEERIARLEGVAATRRATRTLLKRLVQGTDQEEMLDEAMTLIGEQAIDAGLGMGNASSRAAAAWLLLRRADQRCFDERTAIFKSQASKAEETKENEKKPAMSDEEQGAAWPQIFGMRPV
jgi:hypothetical protein